jgi:MFS family permease
VTFNPGLMVALRSRPLLLLSINILLIYFGTYIVTPFVPGYAISIGASIAVAGVVVALMTLASLFIDSPSGWIIAHLGTWPMMMLGAFLHLSSGVLAVAFPNLILLSVSRILLGAGQGMIILSNWTLIRIISEPKNRASFTNVYLIITSLGFILGPIVGGYFIDVYGMRGAFVAQISASGSSLILTTVARFGRRYKILEGSNLGLKEVPKTFIAMIRNSKSRFVIVAAVINSVMISAILNLAIPILGRSSLSLTSGQIGIVIGLNYLMNVLAYAIAGSIVLFSSLKGLFCLGFSLSAVTTVVFGLTRTFFQLELVSVIFGFALGMLLSALIVYGIGEADPKQGSVWIGVYRMFTDGGLLLGPIIEVFLIIDLGLKGSFLILSLVNAAMVVGSFYALKNY